MKHSLPTLLAALTFALGCEALPEPHETDHHGSSANVSVQASTEAPSADAGERSAGVPDAGMNHLARAGQLRLANLGLAQPMGVVHDASADVYLVSSANNAVPTPTPNGFISSILPDGTLEALRWIDGARQEQRLRAPSGMVLLDGRLYVADVDRVVVFDRETGRMRRSIAVEGATGLTDLAAGKNGEVYVCDRDVAALSHSAHRSSLFVISKRGTVRPLLKSSIFGAARSLATLGDDVWMTLDEPNALMGLSRQGRLTRSTLTRPESVVLMTGIDAERVLIARDDTRQIMLGPPSGPLSVVTSDVTSISALAWDGFRQRILMADAATNSIIIQNLATSGLKSTDLSGQAD